MLVSETQDMFSIDIDMEMMLSDEPFDYLVGSYIYFNIV
jgi:hypothetical protein